MRLVLGATFTVVCACLPVVGGGGGGGGARPLLTLPLRAHMTHSRSRSHSSRRALQQQHQQAGSAVLLSSEVNGYA
eukprot:COSAG01_NODE_66000_length_271_cov_1.191860_1_plen_75_part_10